MRHDTRDGERHTCPMFDALLVTYSGMCVESYPRDTILFRLIQPQCSIFGLLENQMWCVTAQLAIMYIKGAPGCEPGTRCRGGGVGRQRLKFILFFMFNLGNFVCIRQITVHSISTGPVLVNCTGLHIRMWTKTVENHGKMAKILQIWWFSRDWVYLTYFSTKKYVLGLDLKVEGMQTIHLSISFWATIVGWI